ncbi:MAG: hypothetical protein IT370_37215 [Deltaproteobacteria bacterium]|nr:hypothetical protein [Deltaproteobacteria bacterium]
MGTALVVAGLLGLAAQRWPEGRARACSPPRGVHLRSIWPSGGQLPANVRFVVTFDGLPQFAEESIAMHDLALRPLDGVGAGQAVPALVNELAGGGPLQRSLSVQATTPLDVGRDYELVGRFADDAQCGTRCLIVATPVQLGRFRTGPVDLTAPVFAGAQGATFSGSLCDSTACCGPYNGYSVTFATAPVDEPVLYVIRAAATGQLVGLDSQSGFLACTGTSPAQVQLTPGEYVVRAVDQAGNEDANDHRVRLAPSCPASSGGDGSAGGGCTVAPGGRTTTGFFAGVLLGIVVVGLVWARRRGVWRSG